MDPWKQIRLSRLEMVLITDLLSTYDHSRSGDPQTALALKRTLADKMKAGVQSLDDKHPRARNPRKRSQVPDASRLD